MRKRVVGETLSHYFRPPVNRSCDISSIFEHTPNMPQPEAALRATDPIRHAWNQDGGLDQWLSNHSSWVAAVPLALAFLCRLWAAGGTFLNPDEALHFEVANQTSLLLAYHASRTIAHPPLLILVLYFWRALGTSEFKLRLLSVLAGTIFCWVFWRWLTSIFGRTVGWIGLVLACFLPSTIELSAEVRQYALFLLFSTGAAYLAERAFARDSASAMLLSSLCLYLAMLSHYSAFLFAAILGLYCILRIAARHFSARVVVAWAIGQIGGVALALFLYRTQLSTLGKNFPGSPALRNFGDWFLKDYYYHPEQANLASFIYHKSFGVFRFIFGQPTIGGAAAVAFLVAVIILLRAKQNSETGIALRQLGMFLLLPFVLGCSAGIARVYPYGRTRHSAFLIMFAIAGVSFLLAKLASGRTGRGVALAVLLVAGCQTFGTLREPDMLPRSGQQLTQMAQAMNFIHQQIPPTDLIFVPFATGLQMEYYLCNHQTVAIDLSVPGFRSFDCGGHRVISTDMHGRDFSAEDFSGFWTEMITTYNLPPGKTVWVIQAGWIGSLGDDLKRKFPEFSALEPRSFGPHLQIFKLTVGQATPRSALNESASVYLC